MTKESRRLYVPRAYIARRNARAAFYFGGALANVGACLAVVVVHANGWGFLVGAGVSAAMGLWAIRPGRRND